MSIPKFTTDSHIIFSTICKQLECPICTISKSTSNFTTIKACGHSFCSFCIQSYLLNQIDMGKFYPLKCPNFECTSEDIDIEEFQGLLTDEQFQQFARLKQRALLEKDPNFRWCPKPDCKGYCYIENSNMNLKCNLCSFEFCASCKEAWHTGICISVEDGLRQYAKDKNLKKCPSCHSYVEKVWGCSTIVCRCGVSFCMSCGNLLDDKHDPIVCTLGGNYSNASWGMILLFLAAWVIFPIDSFILIVHIGENWGGPEIEDKCDRYIWEHRKVFYVIAFLLSPIFTVLLLILFAGIFSNEILNEYLKSHYIEERLNWKVWLAIKIVYYILSTIIILVLIVLVWLIFHALLPLFGLGLLIAKLVYICKKAK
ncbi:unnamed protein product [Blepharisma stoltei]|uniref:RBR-type E3 ubiquitin transferase n=1 Tax=Blepharisma stoltei TaxID=1481888 RepID=A0AAU9JAQ0_9CILI|nr:unnamed protein product [Blepharisma stoltei]